jgi:glycosyltransferase involved in cell wall biosynthesis
MFRLLHVLTVPWSAKYFLRGQADFMRRFGLETTLVASPDDALNAFGEEEAIATAGVPITRRISPGADVRSLLRLYTTIRQIRPAIVHAHSPKGGLLGMMAATMARVPVRIYHIRGLPYMTATGGQRWLLKSGERLSCRLANRVLCVGRSIRDVAIQDGLAPNQKIQYVRNGSGNGVDADHRYNFARLPASTRETVRSEHGISTDALVLGFVGRLVGDKGIVELAEAWQSLRRGFPHAHLLVVGPFEKRDAVPPGTIQLLEHDPRVHLTGDQTDMPKFYAAMDVLALPTYREGFPVSVLEASAMELPIVATRIPGCVDAVVDGVTGTLVPPRDADALADAVRRYLSSAELRRAHGEAGRRRVLRDFRPEDVWRGILDVYRELLASRGLFLPESQADPIETPYRKAA